MKRNFKDKKLVVFDLDGTLTPSKSKMDAEMSGLLAKLLEQKKVAVIGGGKYHQFKTQFLSALRVPKPMLKNIFLFPTTSTAFYRYAKDWKRIYAHYLTKKEKKKIMDAFRHAFRKTGYVQPKKLYGKVIEDRGTQVTFSALGQKAPVKEKERWQRTMDVRPKLMRIIQKYVPELEVRRGGLTSIDVTIKGIDKAYGVRQIRKQLKIPISEMLFVGDALYPGGNDYAAKRTGIDCVQVWGPNDTKKIIRQLLKEN